LRSPIHGSAGLGRLIFESGADAVTIAPNQSAPAHCTEIIERNAKIGRHHIELEQSDARAIVGDISYAARVNAGTSREKQ
jgi:hypothetical protein